MKAGEGSHSGHVPPSSSGLCVLHGIEGDMQTHLVLTSSSVESFQFSSPILMLCGQFGGTR